MSLMKHFNNTSQMPQQQQLEMNLTLNKEQFECSNYYYNSFYNANGTLHNSSSPINNANSSIDSLLLDNHQNKKIKVFEGYECKESLYKVLQQPQLSTVHDQNPQLEVRVK